MTKYRYFKFLMYAIAGLFLICVSYGSYELNKYLNSIVKNDQNDATMREGISQDCTVWYIKVPCGESDKIIFIPVLFWMLRVYEFPYKQEVCYGKWFDKVYFIKPNR